MKSLISLATLAIVTAGCLSSCGSKKTADNSASALTDSTEQAELIPDSIDAGYYLTADSIGPVHVGMALSDIPDRCPDLYDAQVPAEAPTPPPSPSSATWTPSSPSMTSWRGKWM